MASEMSIAQNFRQLTVTLLADSVTVNVDVKTLKGQYKYSLTNNYTDLSFNAWSEDHEPSEPFLKIVREMQITPNSYYLETEMNQSLVNNFAINCTRPKVTTIEQDKPQEDETNRQSPCSSNWSDYLHLKMIWTMRVQNKQNPQLIPTNLLLPQVHRYHKIIIMMPMLFWDFPNQFLRL